MRPAVSPRTGPRWSRPWPPRRCPNSRLLIGGSFGAGNYGMCGRAYGPRFLWSWPNARIAVMGGEQAARVLATVRRDSLEAQGKSWSVEEEQQFMAPTRRQFEVQSHPYYATARLGRWYRRSGAITGAAGSGPGRGAECATDTDAIRRLPHVVPEP